MGVRAVVENDCVRHGRSLRVRGRNDTKRRRPAAKFHYLKELPLIVGFDFQFVRERRFGRCDRGLVSCRRAWRRGRARFGADQGRGFLQCRRWRSGLRRRSGRGGRRLRTGKFVARDQAIKIEGLLGQRLRGCRCLLDQRGVLLGNAIHGGDRLVHLLDAGRLFSARTGDFRHDVR